MSCGAKLPVYGLITAAIFPGNSALVVLSLYLLGIIMMVVAGLVLRRTTFREGETPFVMELPAYRVPSVKNVARRPLGPRQGLHRPRRHHHLRHERGGVVFAVLLAVLADGHGPGAVPCSGVWARSSPPSLRRWALANGKRASRCSPAGGQGSGGLHHAGAVRRRFHGAAWHVAGDEVHPRCRPTPTSSSSSSTRPASPPWLPSAARPARGSTRFSRC